MTGRSSVTGIIAFFLLLFVATYILGSKQRIVPKGKAEKHG
jgi:hypothetical protein